MKHRFFRHTLPAALLAVSMLVSLAACAQPHTDPTQTTTAPPPASTAAPTEPAPTTAPTQPATVPTEPEQDSFPELDQLREDLSPSAAMAGVFYLGYYEGEPLDDGFFSVLEEAGYLSRYPFLLHIPLGRFADAPGGELYCIIPADPESSVVVTLWDESEGEGVAGEVLYESSTGEPFFLRGNVSDIMPNLSVTITNRFGHTVANYHPHLSLRDGTLADSGEGDYPILDLSLYESQPGDDNPADLYTFNIYLPDETLEFCTVTTADSTVRSPEFLIQTLIELRALPDTVQVNSFVENNPDLYLDLNAEFTEYINSLGMTGEQVLLTSLVNTFLDAYQAGTLTITVDGSLLETVHHIYPDPLIFQDITE